MEYNLTQEQIKSYHDNGFLHLQNFLDDSEMIKIEKTYNKFTNHEVPDVGIDLTDLDTIRKQKDRNEYRGISVMIPRVYDPEIVSHVYDQRSAHVVAQLLGKGMVMDFDRIIAKRPNQEGAVVVWHQDEKHCHDTDCLSGEDKRGTTVTLALDDTTVDNGCLYFVPGSHKEENCRVHKPLGSPDEVGVLSQTELYAGDLPIPVCLKRGDILVHGPRVVHGSPGNKTAAWRRSYLLVFCSEEGLQRRLRKGFPTHSLKLLNKKMAPQEMVVAA